MFYLKSVHLGEKFKIGSGFPSTNFYNMCVFLKRSIEKRQNGVWSELVAEQLAAEDGKSWYRAQETDAALSLMVSNPTQF